MSPTNLPIDHADAGGGGGSGGADAPRQGYLSCRSYLVLASTTTPAAAMNAVSEEEAARSLYGAGFMLRPFTPARNKAERELNKEMEIRTAEVGNSEYRMLHHGAAQ